MLNTNVSQSETLDEFENGFIEFCQEQHGLPRDRALLALTFYQDERMDEGAAIEAARTYSLKPSA